MNQLGMLNMCLYERTKPRVWMRLHWKLHGRLYDALWLRLSRRTAALRMRAGVGL